MSDAFRVEDEAAEALLGEVVDEYLGRLERGERPSVEEYAARHPQLAGVLRQMLPAVPLLRWSAAAGPGAGPDEGARPEGPLGDYRIVREVGRGGMGVVYEAVQISLGRRVALKVLPFAAALDAKHLQRFKNEAHAAAQLHHTNIVPVYGVGCERGVHFYAMQFIDGQSLAATIGEMRRLARPGAPPAGAQPTVPYTPAAAADTAACPAAALSTERSARGPEFFRAAAHLGVQAARALDHAHALGVVHRDVKPGNLLLDGRGNLWVTDFGLAQVQSDTRLTLSGDLVGTLRYMSPEQALARRVVIDHRTDVYSLGATLYELLTLEPAFAGRDRQELLRQIAFEEPRPPRRLNPALPAELETVVLKALAKNPDERYATARELADDLERFLKDEPIRARRPTLPQRARKWARRHRPVVVSAAAAALTVLGVAVLTLGVSYAQVKEEEKQTREEKRRAEEALQGERQAREDLEWALYFQRVATAQRELEANNVGLAEELLDECPFALRGWEWHYLKRRRYQPPLTFARHRHWATGVAFSPDGKRLASAGTQGEVYVWERATGKVLRTLSGPPGPASVAFSPDGRLLASGRWDKTVKVWSAATGRELRTLGGHGGSVRCVAFSPDGKLLAAAGADSAVAAVKVWATDDFREVRTLSADGRAVYALAFSPDGKLLISDERATRLWDVAAGREVRTVPAGAAGAAFSPDGRLLATAQSDGPVQLWDAASGRHVATLRGHTFMTTSVAFSPDGKRLAAGSWDKTVKVWDLASGREAITLRGHDDMLTGVAFSPDGQQIASASMDKTVRVWDAAPLGVRAGEVLTLRGHNGGVLDLAYRPDGKVLASASLDATVRLWDAAGGEVVRTLQGFSGPALNVSFSRDGRRLATADIHGVAQVWDVATGREVRKFRAYAVRVGLSPDGKRLATARAGAMVHVWDVDTGREVLRPFKSHVAPVGCVAFSPDGTRLATGSWDSTAKLWDAATGRELHVLKGHTHAVSNALVFSPDGKRLATASWDGTARVWDVESGKELVALRGHKDRVLNVTFSPDGKRLATASWDNTAKVWDAATGAELATLDGSGGVGGVAFSPDGKRLATGSGHHGRGEVTIWDATRWGKTPPRP